MTSVTCKFAIDTKPFSFLNLESFTLPWRKLPLPWFHDNLCWHYWRHNHAGHFLPEEDDKFLERIQAAVEEEERQAKAAAATDAAKDAIAAAEESRKVSQGAKLDSKDERSNYDDEENQEQRAESRSGLGSLASTSKESEKQGSDGQSHGAYDYVANLPPEFYHYYHGSNTDMGTLIEVI